MLTIQPRHLTLAKLLNGRLFEIPDYQRAYSWTSRERKDLFGDIENVFAKNSQESHFMATIVCLHKDSVTLGTDEYDQLDVVDGQQRLTTIILLLNAIKLALRSEKEKFSRIYREIEELLVKVDGDNLLLLQTNLDSSHYFSDFLHDREVPLPNRAKTLADRELLSGIKDCQDFVAEWVEKQRKLIDLYACVKNQLSFILHQISDEKLVYTVFEVLNSRGMEVSWLDRLKSILMGKAFELENTNRDRLIKDLHIIWRDIYAQLGLRQGLNTEALRFAATLWKPNMPSRPLSERDAVDGLRLQAHDSKSIRDVARWLLKVTKACDKVISNRRRNAVTRISQARMLAVALHLSEELSNTERENLLSQWERVTFRIYGMLGRDARTRVGDYVRLAWRIVNEDIAVNQMGSEINSIGKEFPIEDAVKALANGNCYEGWQDELRYFMFRYEEHLAAGINFRNEQWERIWRASPAKSIEHIVSQKTATADIIHTLGNLMILPPNLNSKLQDKPPEVKSDEYRKTGLLTANEVADMGEWTRESLRQREEALLRWASVEWGD